MKRLFAFGCVLSRTNWCKTDLVCMLLCHRVVFIISKTNITYKHYIIILNFKTNVGPLHWLGKFAFRRTVNCLIVVNGWYLWMNLWEFCLDLNVSDNLVIYVGVFVLYIHNAYVVGFMTCWTKNFSCMHVWFHFESVDRGQAKVVDFCSHLPRFLVRKHVSKHLHARNNIFLTWRGPYP